MTTRPSASVLVTSVVRPPYWRTTSPGRRALPPTAFSAAATRPVTLTGQPTAARAPMTASTTAPPVMSRFMLTIASAGLMDSPPVSKVIPLPTRTRWAALRAPFDGVYSSWISRGGRGRALPDAEDAAEAVRLELLDVPDLGLEPGLLGQQDGLVGQPLRVLDVGRDRCQQPGAPAGAADGERPVERAGQVGVVGYAGEDDLPDRRVLGGLRPEVEGERARAWPRRRTPRSRRRARSRGSRWRRCSGRGWPGPAPRRPAGSPRRAGRRPRPGAPSAGRGSRSRRAGSAPRRPRRPCRLRRSARARRAGRYLTPRRSPLHRGRAARRRRPGAGGPERPWLRRRGSREARGRSGRTPAEMPG